MYLPRFIACCLLGISSFAAVAQMSASTDAQAPAAGSIATPAAAFDSQLTLIEKSMMGLVKAMPADKFSFAPNQSIFV
ncbi:MAG: DinB family protein, partial [Silvibacterium sp.]|nr:DinB family protein [Silvibacterium sp.]